MLTQKVSREAEMQMYGRESEDGLKYTEMVESLRACTADDGFDMLNRMGYEITEQEATAFKLWPASTDGDSLLLSLPACFQPPGGA